MPTVSSPAADPVLDTHVWWEQHKTQILLGLALALVALAAWIGYRVYQDRTESSAAALLTAAKTPADFQKVITQYATTSAAGDAYLLLAQNQRNAKNFAEANKTLQEFVAKNPKHQLVTTALMAVAANLESLGKPEEALSTYQRLAAGYHQSFNAPLALISEVHLLKNKGQIEEARRVCETVLTQYRESFVASEATRQLRLLKPAAPTPTTPVPVPATVQTPPVAAAPAATKKP